MYAMLLFFSLLTNTLVLTASEKEAEEYSLHWVVEEVARGHFAEIEQAKEKVEKLLRTQDLNKEQNYQTAAQLSAHYCASSYYNFENQLSLLKLLLTTPEGIEYNKKRILEDLKEKTEKININRRGLKRGPFKVTVVCGGGACIDDESENEAEENFKNKEYRIKCVQELLEKTEIQAQKMEIEY